MIVGYGHLTVLIKKQLSENYRKAAARFDLQKKKENYLKKNSGRKSDLEFPEVTIEKLNEIKLEIRRKAHKADLLDLFINLAAITAVLLFLITTIKYYSSY